MTPEEREAGMRGWRLLVETLERFGFRAEAERRPREQDQDRRSGRRRVRRPKPRLEP